MPRPSPDRARYSHLGICVSDLDRSLHFYREAFGFEAGRAIDVVDDQHALLGVGDDVALRSRFLRRGDLVIELLRWDRPGDDGEKAVRRLNQIGLTHLSFNVDALDPAMARVESAGGGVLAETRTRFDLGEMVGEIVFVYDPDGVRIELMAFPEDVVNA